jgi:ABC-2 type transport system permease protein
MFFTFAFPAMMLVIFGGIFGNKPSKTFGGFGSLDELVPAYISLIIGVTGLMSFPLSIAEYKEHKIFKRFEGTPAGKNIVIMSQVIVNIVMALIGIALLFAVGLIVYQINVPGNFAAVVAATLFATVSIFSIGSTGSGGSCAFRPAGRNFQT